ncbi:MAG TPA: hypothetical protein VFN03_06160, partial [Trueperaceae bacterium]|nr:hypothetical protein [Trueperaceae bacterium]
ELQAADALREIGWSQEVDRTVQRYGPQRVIDIVGYARRLQSKAEASGRPILNLAGFVNSLLTQGFEPPREEQGNVSERPLSVEEARSIAAAIAAGYHQARRDQARRAWEQMGTDNRDVIHTIMQATLHRFTLDRIAAAGWDGPLYETSRLDVMVSHNAVSFEAGMRDIGAYLDESGVLRDYPDEARRLIETELTDAL